jgi:hypothetical protein
MSSDIISVIADALNFVLLVLTTVGVLLTRHQLKLASNIQKASFLKSCT